MASTSRQGRPTGGSEYWRSQSVANSRYLGRTLVAIRLSGLAQGRERFRFCRFAAVLDPRLKRLTLEDMLMSYQSVVAVKIHRNIFENVVQGALRSYDLPDLAAALSPRPITLVNLLDPQGRPVPPAQVKQTYASANVR